MSLPLFLFEVQATVGPLVERRERWKKGSREMHRERKTPRVVWDPALPRWANFCRAYGAIRE